MYIDTETLITAIYFIVDNWYLTEGHKYLRHKSGKKPVFTDSEMITFIVLKEFFLCFGYRVAPEQFKSERRFLGFMHGNYFDMFPNMVDQAQFNRRSRALRLIVDKLRSHFADSFGAQLSSLYVLDTEPIPVVGYKRPKEKSDFLGRAEYGYCKSKSLHYWGFKLVMLITTDEIPVAFELVPANTDERDAAEEILYAAYPGSIVLGDKGFIDEERQEAWEKRYGVCVCTFKRKNQHKQNPPAIQRMLKENREQVETAFSSMGRVEGLANQGAKTFLGLISRTIAKIATYTFRKYLLRFFGIDVLTFQTVNIS